jgi:hypothetical protein
MALLIRRYEVLVPVSLEGKTMEEEKRKILTWVAGMIVAPTNTWVRVKERSN